MLPARDKVIRFFLIVAFAAAAVAPMLAFGVPGGNDAVQHYEFAQQVVDTIREGGLFPSFASNSNHGLGDVGLRVYPPAAYYVLACAYFIFGSWYSASIVVFFLIFLIGAIGVYLWVGESFSPKTATIAAALFTLMPFHLNEIYNNFLFAQFTASAVLPFCFLFTNRVIKRGRLIDSVGLAVSITFLIVTHLPLTIIGSMALAVYAVTMLDRDSGRPIAKLAVSVIAGIGMSSFYWVRMLAEMSWVKHSAPQYFAKTWSYSENYLFSIRTFTEFLDDELALWFGDIVLAVTLLICTPALVYFFRRLDLRPALLPVLIVFGLAIAMTTPLSAVIWDNFPLLQKVQFPWRWLGVVSLTASVLAAVGLVSAADELKEVNNRTAMLGISAAVLPFVVLSAFIVKAPHYTQRPEFEKAAAEFSAGETFEGWWPVWARREALSDGEAVALSNRETSVQRWDGLERKFEIGPGEPGEVKIRTFYYPQWKAFVDGQETGVRPDPLGLISFDVPAEAVTVSLRFEEPPAVKMSIWLSAACWLGALLSPTFILIRQIRNYGKYR